MQVVYPRLASDWQNADTHVFLPAVSLVGCVWVGRSLASDWQFA